MALPNQITVSGAGTTAVNGTYTLSNNEDNPNILYRNDATSSIAFYYESNRIGIINANNGSYFYREAIGSTSSSETSPVGLVYQIGSLGAAPAPTVEEGGGAPPINTFGLPFTTVALITANFGTVENFLRLRNQGQV